MPAEIYLDYAATTPVDPRVREVMLAGLDNRNGFGNPSSATHAYGEQAAADVRRAAEQVALLINAQPEELVWTSGATEADNLAILGVARFRRMQGNHIVTAATEHKAVLESCRRLEQEGFEVTYLRPDRQGLIAPESVASAIKPNTILVSLMHANNETGVVQNVSAVGQMCREHNILLHVDAAQSIGKLAVDVVAQNIDLLSLTAHKACGPKGVGALYMNAKRIPRLEPVMYGGGQQSGLRPGTLPVHQIIGMGKAMAILHTEQAPEVAHIENLRKQLWAGIAAVPGTSLNGHPEERLCSILNVSVAGVEGESLQFALQGLAVASGSACNSSSGEPSYVLRSLGLADHQAEASIRFSIGRFTTPEEIREAIGIFARAVSMLRALSPAVARSRGGA